MDNNKLWPGKIHGGIPNPTEIACIWVTKIYDACSQRECEEFFFDDLDLPDAPLENLTVECSIQPCSETFTNGEIEPIDDGPLGTVTVDVCANLVIVIRDSENPSNFTTNVEEVCFSKQVILYAPDPIHMEVLAESIFESLLCIGEIVVDDEEEDFVVTATIGAFIIVKTALQVQLLVPAYGFCPVPPECEDLGDVCEQFLERPFPPFFPPQLTDLDDD